MNRTLPLLLLLLAHAACGSEDRPASPPTPIPPLPPSLTSATQQDLARELVDANNQGTWSELKRRWQGQVLRWNVTRQRVLCQSAELCHVAAFPIQRPAKQGWLPQLSFAAGQ